MIELLKESTIQAFGFKVVGKLTAADMDTLTTLFAKALQQNGEALGVLADLSEMRGATWNARWRELRFLQTHSDDINRIAIVCRDKWHELAEMGVVAAAFLEAETVYCAPAGIHHAWLWVKMSSLQDDIPMSIA